MVTPVPDLLLLRRAHDLAAQHTQVLDTLHVVLAALLDPRVAGPAGEVLIHQVSQQQRETLLALAQFELDAHAPQPSAYERKSDRLLACEVIWQRDAAKMANGLTSALVLWTIISNDATLGAMLARCQVSREALLTGLARCMQYPDPTAAMLGTHGQNAWAVSGGTVVAGSWPDPLPWTDGRAPRPTSPADVWRTSAPQAIQGSAWEMYPSPNGEMAPDDQTIMSQARLFTRTLEGSRGLELAPFHHGDMSAFLTVLARSPQTREVPVLMGHPGSPVAILGQVLADRLLQRQWVGTFGPLAAFDSVLRLGLSEYLALPEAVAPPALGRVFSLVERQAGLSRPIIMLDHLELLRDNPDQRDQLTLALANPLCPPVFGVWHLRMGASSAPDEVRQILPNVVPCAVHPYNGDQTRDLLRKGYMPLWEKQYYARFQPNAFDWVLDLHEGAWAGFERKVLPYLAVDLGWNALQTLREGEAVIRQVALSAVAAVGRLKREEADAASQQLRDKLNAVEAGLKSLAQDPRVSRHGNTVEVTRVLVTAHLLCSGGELEYHIPPRTPAGMS